MHRDGLVLLHQRVDVKGCRRRHGPLGDGLGIDNERFAEDLARELTALEERIVARHVRENRSEVCARGVSAYQEALRDVALQRGCVLCDL